MEEAMKRLQESVHEELNYMCRNNFGSMRANKVLNECLILKTYRELKDLELTKTKLTTNLLAYINNCEVVDLALSGARKEILKMYVERMDYDPQGLQIEKGDSSGTDG